LDNKLFNIIDARCNHEAGAYIFMEEKGSSTCNEDRK